MTSLLETDDTFYIARRYRAQAHLLAGDPEKAMADLLLLPQERSEDLSFRLPMLARAHADMGETQRSEQVFETLLTMARTDYVVSWNLAIVAAGLGRLEETMAYLEDAYEQHESTLPFLKSLPWFAAVAATQRFRTLLMKTGPVL
jgi:tetratricopeptide (TPR) repeat protein